jgi:fatty-acyl-CoA synthase
VAFGDQRPGPLLRDHLAKYKVPREVIFLDELPRNPTGKSLKRELRGMEVE